MTSPAPQPRTSSESAGRTTTRSCVPATPQTWLDRFVSAVRNNDIDAGRRLFADDAVGYGALTARMLGLESLVAQQWRPTWARVAQWDVTEVDLLLRRDDLAVLAFCWQRLNNDDGATVPGRATMVLQHVDDRWLCVHSHFSASP
ncbi:MAG TPA: nuclear transport factor 2 family protein [Candidatus Nanopelagicales bacterium]|nr:nuclear transport factor 2 family protein [Candidatus Nanopelagicales bacterium]